VPESKPIEKEEGAVILAKNYLGELYSQIPP
jgi:hypothetical protein